MSAGTGVDIVSISRLGRVLERRPRLADRAYTAAERQACARHPERWASRWAAKEAVRKLFGAAGLPLPAFGDIEVVLGAAGAPSVHLHGEPADLALSLSHEADLAVAVVTGSPTGAVSARVPAGLRLAARPDDAHKGTFGTVVVVGGAVGTSGAPLMSAMAAARGGAGKVRLCVPEPVYLAVAAQALEVMAHPVPATGGGLGAAALGVLVDEHLGDASAVVVGPGVGRAPGTEALVLELLPRLTVPAVVDADALNIAAAHHFDWRRCEHPVVVTPHPAEMARLCEIPTRDVQARRREVARDYAARTGCVVVLKGSETVVAEPGGREHVSDIRVVALATGGTGDVLSGLLAAFLAQGLDAFDACVAAVFIHAEAALALQARSGRAGVLPRDLLDELPGAQERTRRVVERREGSR